MTSKKFKQPPKSGSYSQDFLNTRKAPPSISALTASSVSHIRKETLAEEVDNGFFRDGTGPTAREMQQRESHLGNVTASSGGFNKMAQVTSPGGDSLGAGIGGGSSYGGGMGNSVTQISQIYSPLWLTSNLNLPRDRATINAWCRAYFALNPFVNNAIQLHSTYPISKLSIKCPNPEIQKFFDEQIEELDLMNVCVQIAQEFNLLGEAFPYAEYDESKGKWSRIMLQNPDYMIVKRTVIPNEPVIMLRPDENLKRVVNSNRPSDVEQRKQLSQYIIDSVKRGENIVQNNFNSTHLARKISPYEIRGTGLPVCIFRQLMLFDKLREAKFAQADNMINPLTLIKIGSEGADGLHPTVEQLEAWRAVFECHDEETEVLTKDGFKKFHEVIDYSDAISSGKDPSGAVLLAKPKSGVEIACFNPDNEQLEYHAPSAAHVANYKGEMYHFHNKKYNIKVTPNHKMFVSKQHHQKQDGILSRLNYWDEPHFVEAKDMVINGSERFHTQVKWVGDDSITEIDMCGKKLPIELYLEFLGYVLSEGCIYTNDKHQYTVSLCQTLPKYYNEMKSCLKLMATFLNKGVSHHITQRSKHKVGWSDLWTGVISGENIYDFIKSEVSDANGLSKAPNKRVPHWIKQLSPRLLQIILDAAIKGDGSIKDRKAQNSNGFAYYSTSKQLADDVYEMAYKCGYTPTMFVRVEDRTATGRLPLYTVSWTNKDARGTSPLVYKTSKNVSTKVKHSTFDIVDYSGKVWCFTVPTGLFITRRNGKITIQGNSGQNNPDFKIFTHPGVTVERVGYGQGIYDTSGDITQIIKEMYIGLQVPQVILDGGGDVTYGNAGITVDVLRQRYMQFRNMMTVFLKRKIFAPISHIQGFYNVVNGKKELIVPDVEWNHMSLFDAGDYINTLVTLTTPGGEGVPPRATMHTLYRSLGLEWEDEQRKMRKEAIQNEINRKEEAALQAMTLTELRSLDEDEDIPEPIAPEATEQPGGEAAVPGEIPGLGGGGLPPLPPMPSGGGGGGGGLPGLGTPPTETPPATPPSGPATPPPAAPPPPTP